ncbi:hypothetical protein CH373_06310 [Leptospira perolatii]|uniref:Uncharacterized protein n=1 Tax=Leptospira perolatii TaxID=2023191 RepID=A0A2M9ZNV8_9LEPT|nr:hypothetical protein [Leptospira perolatii]PJZ70874.1 hypothetical protein CH360_05040 [Leptospira perolatii]PJZ73770.1 hypothetical protein CH373_06310 [Leptospira perolatii]
MSSLSEWYFVTFDSSQVHRRVQPPGGDQWEDSFAWSEIIRVCYEPSEDFMTSDTIYIFTGTRQESYTIPSEANGAQEFWGEILHRGLFDAETSINISMGRSGFSCWPPITEEEISSIE